MTGVALPTTAVHLRSYSLEQAAHAHSFHQLVLPLHGRLELEVQGRRGEVADLSCVLVPAGMRHAFSATGDNRFVVMDAEHDLVEQLDAGAWLDRRVRSCFFPAPRRVLQLARLLANDIQLESSSPEVHRAWITLIIQAAAQTELYRPPAAVGRALRFIESRASAPVSVGDVARAAQVSIGHLHTLFRAHVGQTPRRVLLNRRLEQVRELLIGTDLPIAEIALRCGFADQASLTHAMRRLLDTTPARFRRGVPPRPMSRAHLDNSPHMPTRPF